MLTADGNNSARITADADDLRRFSLVQVKINFSFFDDLALICSF